MVLRIFTENSISLSPCWRQRGSRYTIRAGRYLCDKEFRYLRTVRVTAAVYRGFHSKLKTLLLFTFQHRAGVRLYTSCCHLAESCVFNKQSLPPGMCRFPNPEIGEHPFSRSYGVILPSSFNMVLSSALVCSTCSPVSVWGTVLFHEVFSWKSSGLPNHPIHEFNKHAKKKFFCSIVEATSSLSCTHRTKPFRGFLRDRFTLRRLTERRNP